MAASTLAALAVLEKGEPVELVRLHLEDAGVAGINEGDLAIRTNLSEKQLARVLQDLSSRGEAVQFDREGRRFADSRVLTKLTELLKGQLQDFHQREPLRSGMSKEELFGRMPGGVDGKLFSELLQGLIRQGQVAQEKELVRLASHQVELAADQEKLREEIEGIYRQAGLQPPFYREVTQSLGVPEALSRQLLTWMLEQGMLVKVKEDMYFHRGALADLKRRLLDFFAGHEEISTPQFKDLTQATRKYTIPLLEHLDATRFTIRIGDVRRLREGGK
jgi:selenocysteine-specific elongation factor